LQSDRFTALCLWGVCCVSLRRTGRDDSENKTVLVLVASRSSLLTKTLMEVPPADEDVQPEDLLCWVGREREYRIERDDLIPLRAQGCSFLHLAAFPSSLLI
jgi:hypothetical protein